MTTATPPLDRSRPLGSSPSPGPARSDSPASRGAPVPRAASREPRRSRGGPSAASLRADQRAQRRRPRLLHVGPYVPGRLDPDGRRARGARRALPCEPRVGPHPPAMEGWAHEVLDTRTESGLWRCSNAPEASRASGSTSCERALSPLRDEGRAAGARRSPHLRLPGLPARSPPTPGRIGSDALGPSGRSEAKRRDRIRRTRGRRHDADCCGRVRAPRGDAALRLLRSETGSSRRIQPGVTSSASSWGFLCRDPRRGTRPAGARRFPRRLHRIEDSRT